MSACGLDFGTSNTTLGSTVDHAPELVALEDGQTTIPSAIFYGRDGAVLVGRKAIDAYVEGIPGRLMRSLKSVLGTALVDETTQVGVERSSFRDVIAVLSPRGETTGRAGLRPGIPQRRSWPSGSLRRQCAGRRSQGRSDAACDRPRDRLRRRHVSVRADRRRAGLRTSDLRRRDRADRRYRRRDVRLLDRPAEPRASRQG